MTEYQLQKSREEAIAQVWGRCASLYVEPRRRDQALRDVTIIGRCSGNRLQAHHEVFRSAGGADTADNISPWCEKCHMLATHLEGKRQGPYSDYDGFKYWTEDWGDSSAVRKVWIYDWRDFEPLLQQQAVLFDDQVHASLQFQGLEKVRMGMNLAEMDRLGLFELVDVENLSEYARSLGRNPKSFHNAARVGAWVLTLPKPYQAMILGQADDDAPPVDYSILRDALPTLRALPEGELGEELGRILFLQQGGAGVDEIAKMVTGEHSARSVPEWRVTFDVGNLEGRRTFEVEAKDGSAAVKKARSLLARNLDAPATFERLRTNER